MPIPEFNEIKAPALKWFAQGDGKPHRISEVFDALADHFNLTEEERNELLPSGVQRRWHNRANWACYDLYRAGLLDRPKKGVYVITDAGKEVAASNPKHIDRTYLMQFPKFVEFMDSTRQSQGQAGAPETAVGEEKSQTPEEQIGNAYQLLHAALKSELLARVKQVDPFRFQELVIDLLLAMGYGGSREEAAEVAKRGPDEGIDGIINEDRLGLDVIYIQAKRWQQTVGRKEIQSFVGALAGQQAHKGIFITTSDFAAPALEYARKVSQKVILIDGPRLAELMIQHGIGVSLSHAYEIKQIDGDYFGEE